MPRLIRKFVIPGDVIATGEYRFGNYIERRNNKYIALRVGLAEIGKGEIKLNPLSGPYIPHVDDQVIGKVIDINPFGWQVDINSPFFGYLPATFVFGKEFSSSKDELSSRFKIGDLMMAKIEAFDRTRDPQLSVRGPGLGKIPKGEIVKMSPTKIPRLIGRKGYMINMIASKTGCEFKIGLNGLIVLTGPPEGIIKAVNAIKMVEQEAHSAELAKKIQAYLSNGEK